MLEKLNEGASACNMRPTSVWPVFSIMSSLIESTGTGRSLALRPGARAALIAYAGSAHLVVPLTSDPEVISFFASELEPDLMPLAGDEPVQALTLANQRLEASGMPGSVVLVADAVDPMLSGEIEALREAGSADIHVYAVAAGPEVVPPAGSPPAPALDENAMQSVARAGGGTLVRITPDDTDLKQLASRIERSIASAPVQEGERWKDAGPWLVLLLVPLALNMVWPKESLRAPMSPTSKPSLTTIRARPWALIVSLTTSATASMPRSASLSRIKSGIWRPVIRSWCWTSTRCTKCWTCFQGQLVCSHISRTMSSRLRCRPNSRMTNSVASCWSMTHTS